MNTITLWLLIAALGPAQPNRQPLVVDRFATERDCKAVGQQLEKAPNGIPTIYTFCVEAKVYRP